MDTFAPTPEAPQSPPRAQGTAHALDGPSTQFVPLSVSALEGFRAFGGFLAMHVAAAAEGLRGDEPGWLLGRLDVDPERGVADPTTWYDWIESLREALDPEADRALESRLSFGRHFVPVSRTHSFLAMRSFLQEALSESDGDRDPSMMEAIVDDLALTDDGTPEHLDVWEDWLHHLRVTAGDPLSWR